MRASRKDELPPGASGCSRAHNVDYFGHVDCVHRKVMTLREGLGTLQSLSPIRSAVDDERIGLARIGKGFALTEIDVQQPLAGARLL